MPAHRETETNPHSFCSFHFSQKRAKKIEGGSIYIRHSLLMLEVCIPSGDISLCCLFLLFGFCLITLARGMIHTFCISTNDWL